MTKHQAFREANQRWASYGTSPTDRVAMVTLRQKKITHRCEVGWYLRGDGVFVVAGRGPTWEAAFTDADARSCRSETP